MFTCITNIASVPQAKNINTTYIHQKRTSMYTHITQVYPYRQSNIGRIHKRRYVHRFFFANEETHKTTQNEHAYTPNAKASSNFLIKRKLLTDKHSFSWKKLNMYINICKRALLLVLLNDPHPNFLEIKILEDSLRQVYLKLFSFQKMRCLIQCFHWSRVLMFISG